MQRAITSSKRTQKQVNFALRVKIALLERDMSISELAENIKLSRNTVSLAINRGLYLPTQNKIAEFLKLS